MRVQHPGPVGTVTGAARLRLGGGPSATVGDGHACGVPGELAIFTAPRRYRLGD